MVKLGDSVNNEVSSVERIINSLVNQLGLKVWEFSSTFKARE